MFLFAWMVLIIVYSTGTGYLLGMVSVSDPHWLYADPDPAF
jgi:hypothetical protein